MNNIKDKHWSYSDWGERALSSPNFESFKVYVVKLFDEYESFIKIGKTYTSTSLRFTYSELPYDFTIIKEYEYSNAKQCSIIEKELHKKYKNLQYYPLKRFAGDNECFELSILNNII